VGFPQRGAKGTRLVTTTVGGPKLQSVVKPTDIRTIRTEASRKSKTRQVVNMGIKWRTQKEVRLLNAAWQRRSELAVDEMVLNDEDVQSLRGGFYFLVDLQPLGGWKGKGWAILWSDLSDIDAWYFTSRADAEREWNPARETAAQGVIPDG